MGSGGGGGSGEGGSKGYGGQRVVAGGYRGVGSRGIEGLWVVGSRVGGVLGVVGSKG